MSQTVFVTGATGLAGANICKLLIERGDHVRALGRAEADTAPLADLGRLGSWADGRGLEVGDLEVRRPTLEDVYLRLTAEAAGVATEEAR